MQTFTVTRSGGLREVRIDATCGKNGEPLYVQIHQVDASGALVATDAQGGVPFAARVGNYPKLLRAFHLKDTFSVSPGERYAIVVFAPRNDETGCTVQTSPGDTYAGGEGQTLVQGQRQDEPSFDLVFQTLVY